MVRAMYIPEIFISAVETLLVDRILHFEVNKEIIRTSIVNKGIPQVSILSSLLFNIHLREQ